MLSAIDYLYQTRRLMTELEHFHAQKDAFFKTHPQSPLTDEQQAAFTGLRYFPENPELQLVLPFEEFTEQDTVVMQTSTCAAQHQRSRASLGAERGTGLGARLDDHACGRDRSFTAVDCFRILRRARVSAADRGWR